jgi:hypothetical protein
LDFDENEVGADTSWDRPSPRQAAASRECLAERKAELLPVPAPIADIATEQSGDLQPAVQGTALTKATNGEITISCRP